MVLETFFKLAQAFQSPEPKQGSLTKAEGET